MAKNRAVIYARFSSHNQRGESIEIQVENSRRYCDDHGLEVMAVYADYAKTGRNTDRAEFQRMMTDAQHGLFDYVVIYKVTRIMRNRDEMALARIMLRKAGVEILYAGEDISEGSSGVLQLGMLEVLAEWESAIDSERIRDGIAKNAERCMANGRTMYGWDILDGRYVINEREANVMRKLKNMLLSGATVADLVRAMDGERTRRGNKWSHTAVKRALSRPQNGGTYTYAGNVVEGGIPALWSLEEQQMVTDILSRPRPRRVVDHEAEWPLTGKLYCAKCGKPLYGTSGTSHTGARYAYYRCRKCRRTFRRDLIEDVVVDMSLMALKRSDVRQRIAAGMTQFAAEAATESQPQSALIRKQIKQIDTSFQRIWDAIEAGIAPPGGKERIDDLKRRKSALEAELATALAEESCVPDETDLMAWLDTAADFEPSELIDHFVRAVEIDGDVLRLFFTFDPWGDSFVPAQYKESEPPADAEGSPNQTMVELRQNRANPCLWVGASPVYRIDVSRSWFTVSGTIDFKNRS